MLPEILVADDEPDIHSLVALIFRWRGWGCHEAATGSEAFHFVRTNPAIGIIFIFIFIAIDMPDQTGLECMARIKGEDKDRNLEFVIIAGRTGLQEAVSALRLGAVDFLSPSVPNRCGSR